jgi:uncharacterized protein YaaQ
MKLIIAIAHERDKHRLAQSLLDNGFQFTKLGSTGGFLRQGNVTVLIGVEDDQVQRAVDIVQDCCGTCESYLNLPPDNFVPLAVGAIPPQPVKTEAGGAVVFVVDVMQFHRF